MLSTVMDVLLCQAEAEVRLAQSEFERHAEVTRLLLQGLTSAQVTQASVFRIASFYSLHLFAVICICRHGI